jgi:lipid-A-disaccharide synthase
MAPQQNRKIALVAGEASGDLLGAHLIQALKKHLPDAEFVGVGGPKMESAGMRVLYPMEKLAVRGYVEVLRHYREIVGIRKKLKRLWLAEKPDIFIGIDAPDFNLSLEHSLKRGGVPTVHYVSPSIWAWRRERMRQISQSVTHMLTLFPFEKPLYDEAGVPASYVGHPLADMLPLEPDRGGARDLLKLRREGTIVALLPGSRQSEVQAMADLFVRTAQRLLELQPAATFLVPLVSRETRHLFEETLYRLNAQDLPLTILFGHAHDALIACDAALVASGTATLEAALLKRPMVISYKMPDLSWRIIKRKKYLPYVGLPNILAGRFVVPELIQEDATADNLAQALSNLLQDKGVAAGLQQVFGQMQQDLRQNTAEKAAGAVLQCLEARG